MIDGFYNLNDSIKEGLIELGEKVFVGWLFTGHLLILNDQGLKELELTVPNSLDPDSFGAETEDAYPYGTLVENNSKCIIETRLNSNSFKNFRRIREYFNSDEYGISARLFDSSLGEIADEDNFPYSSLTVVIELDSNIFVSFEGEHDFPVLRLPLHSAYIV